MIIGGRAMFPIVTALGSHAPSQSESKLTFSQIKDTFRLNLQKFRQRD